MTFSNFRNLQEDTLCLSEGVNILYGDNAQGKTNLLEACWLFTGGKSFRGTKDYDLCTFGTEKATLKMNFEAFGREQTAQLDIVKRRKLTLNGIPQKSPTAITGRFCAVVFCPAHLRLLSGAPEERRRFLDAAYCQLRPAYIEITATYHRTLAQRNALLKSMRLLPYAEQLSAAEQLDLWDDRLAEGAALQTVARLAYLKKISPIVENIYDGLSGGKEQMSLVLTEGDTAFCDADAQYWKAHYLDKISAARKIDLSAGCSTIGAHRQDVKILLDGLSAKDFASQGQQRSAVLALKLAEASLLKEITGEQPVALLDDVMSELDIFRQDYILNHIHDWQVLITCCDPVAIERQTGGKVFNIQDGKIK